MISIDFSGKTALVTGASQGIGAQIARTLHQSSANVALNHPAIGATRDDAEMLVTELNALRPQSAIAVEADVSQSAAVQAMMQHIKEEWGGLDFLVNNAAILRDRTVAKMSLDEWKNVVDVNLSGVFIVANMAWKSCATAAQSSAWEASRLWTGFSDRPIMPPPKRASRR